MYSLTFSERHVDRFTINPRTHCDARRLTRLIHTFSIVPRINIALLSLKNSHVLWCVLSLAVNFGWPPYVPVLNRIVPLSTIMSIMSIMFFCPDKLRKGLIILIPSSLHYYNKYDNIVTLYEHYNNLGINWWCGHYSQSAL